MPASSCDLDRPIATIKQVAAMCGKSVNTLRSWFQTGTVALQQIDVSAPAGGKRLLSVRRVLQIVIMVALVDWLRIEPDRAAGLAFGFSDVGNDKGDPDAGNTERDPGELYKAAYTWL